MSIHIAWPLLLEFPYFLTLILIPHLEASRWIEITARAVAMTVMHMLIQNHGIEDTTETATVLMLLFVSLLSA